MRKRTKSREYALKILYQIDITNNNLKSCVDDFWQDKKEKADIRDFTNLLVEGVVNSLKTIDEKIGFYATNWQLKRMAVVDRNILRLAAYELLFLKDIPSKVSLNEAVELAKRFGDLDSSKFINGILDKIHKTEVKDK